MAERQGAVSRISGAPDPLIGRVINERFRIVNLIARGGMGKVYRAEQAPLGRVCALKVLNPNYSGEHDPEFHKRFFLEASIASKLTHPNTVTIFDYGRTDDEIYYMAMEYLSGVTLHRAIREAGSFPEERASHIARQICRALREAHSHGVIHRDLKPANIFLVEHGDEADYVKVLDFGLVKNVGETKPEDQLTQTGLFMGSPKYMAPEQIRGERVDARTDVYSLGIVMYEMFAGKVPFDRATSLNILMAQVNEPPPPLRTINPGSQASPLMEELIAKCMAKDPDQRFASMNDVLLALKRLGGLTATGTGEFRSNPPLSAASAAESGQVSISRVAVANSGEHPSTAASFPSASPGPMIGPPSGSLPIPAPSGSTRVLQQEAEAPGDSVAIVYPGNPRRGRLWAAVGGGAVIAALVAVYALRGPDTAAPPSTALAATQAPAAPPVVPTSPLAAPPATGTVAAPLTTRVRITSDPPGASVKEDGKDVCASTPCDHDFEADPAKDHRLSFAKPGFHAETRTMRVGESPVNVRLSKSAGGWSPRTPQAPPIRSTPAPDNAPTPSGFKDIPY